MKNSTFEKGKPIKKLYGKARKIEKAEDAEEFRKAFAKLSPEEKIAELDARLGKGVGAIKQRKKIKV